MQKYISIGHTKKLYGVKGGVRVNIKEDFLDDFSKTEVLFLDMEGRKIPYFIQEKIYGAPMRVIFENHTQREISQVLTGKEIFLQEDQATVKEVTPDLIYTPYIGYVLQDEIIGEIGSIQDVLDYPHQEMALIQYKEQDVLIPLNKHIIKEIKEKDKIILVDLPEGLLEL